MAEKVVLSAVACVSQVNLRVEPGSEVATRVANALGVALPTEPNTTATSGDRTVLWLGPDEWLVLGPPGDAGVIEARARAAFGGEWGSVVDVSANRTVLELSGAGARSVLNRGCPLDLHPRVFGPAKCAQTVLARAQVILWQRDDVPTYWIFVRTSFTVYLTDWFGVTARL